jgi:hypothetical protein
MKKTWGWVLVLVYVILFRFAIETWLSYGLWLVGIALSFGWKSVDYLLYGLYSNDDDQAGVAMRQAYQTKQLGLVLQTITVWKPQMKQLISRSIFFVTLLPFLMLFVITSTGSALGAGLVLGLGLQVFLDILYWYDQPERLRTLYLSQVKEAWSDREIRLASRVFLAVYGVLAILAWGASLA